MKWLLGLIPCWANYSDQPQLGGKNHLGLAPCQESVEWFAGFARLLTNPANHSTDSWRKLHNLLDVHPSVVANLYGVVLCRRSFQGLLATHLHHLKPAVWWQGHGWRRAGPSPCSSLGFNLDLGRCGCLWCLEGRIQELYGCEWNDCLHGPLKHILIDPQLASAEVYGMLAVFAKGDPGSSTKRKNVDWPKQMQSCKAQNQDE